MVRHIPTDIFFGHTVLESCYTNYGSHSDITITLRINPEIEFPQDIIVNQLSELLQCFCYQVNINYRNSLAKFWFSLENVDELPF